MKIKHLLTFIFLISFTMGLSAATVTFTGGGDGTSWEDPANWDTGTVPGYLDDVIITGASTVSVSTNQKANKLTLSIMAVLTVNNTGSLLINRLSGGGNALQLDNNSRLTNNGNMNVLRGGNNIDLNGTSEFTNNGYINSIDPGSDPLNLSGSSIFTNNGIFLASDGSDGIDINNSARVFNHGSMDIIDFGDEGIEMSSSTRFTNTGYLKITDVTNDLICLDDSNVQFVNSGTIDLIDAGSSAIEVDDGIFINEASGVINASDTRSSGLNVESGGEFDNYGTINVQVTANSSGDEGIDLESSSFFRNFNILNITLTGNANANAIFLDASTSNFINDACGVVNMLSNHRIELDAGADLINDGVLATLFNGTHDNQGTITNNGAINAPNGFTAAPNAVVGGGAIAAGPVPAQSDCNIAIGGIGCTGSTTVDQVTGTYTQTSDMCLYQVPYLSDKISYAFQQLCGDGEIYAKVASVTTLGWGGVTMRESTDPGSKKVQLMANQSEVLRREIRTVTNGPAYPANIPFYGHNWLRLVRSGDYVAGYVSQNGVNWMFFFNQYIPMADCIEVGVVSTNYNINTSATIVFENVTIIPGVAPIMEEDEVMDTENATELTKEEELGDYSLPAIEGENAIQASIFPNPTTGQVTVEIDPTTDEMVDLRIFNTVGQLMQSHRIDPSYGSLQQVDLTGMPAGMYYFHLLGENGSKRVERVVLK